MASPDEFLAFVSDILRVPSAALSLETAYGSLPEWDSVMHLRLVLEIGEAYGVEIPVDEIAAITTLGQFYAYADGDGTPSLPSGGVAYADGDGTPSLPVDRVGSPFHRRPSTGPDSSASVR